MPTTTNQVKSILIMLLCLVVSLGILAFISNRHINENTSASAEGTLIDLNDATVLTAMFNDMSSNFSTVGVGSYDPTNNPYKIATADDLIRLAYYVNIDHNKGYARASYQMTSHIDLSAFNWAPIGGLANAVDNANIPFCGVFNGDGYSVFGLTINAFYSLDSNGVDVLIASQPGDQDVILDNTCAGLFGAVSYYEYTDTEYMTNCECYPVIKLLGLAHTQIKTNAYYVGSLVGYLCGNNDSSTTINISSSGVADAVASCVVQECYNTGFVHGGYYVGGIAGMVTKGAVVYNCSNAEDSNADWQEVAYGEENALAKIGVYGIDADSNVGGIAGGILEINSSNVIGNSINVASVAKLGVTNNVGGIAGYSNTSNKDNYNSNTYCRTIVYSTIPTSNMLGRGLVLSGSNSITRYSLYSSRISIANMPSGSYLPYTRGTAPDYIWHMGASVNNGLPYLTRVSPLVKIQLKVQQLDNVTPGTINFYGYDANGQVTTGTQWFTPIIISGNTFYIEIGKSVSINTQSSDSACYEFKEWQATSFSTDAYEGTTQTLSETYTQPVMFVSTDCVYTAVYDYVYYAISTYSNDARYGTVLAQKALSNDSSNINWDDIEMVDANVVYARMGDYVKFTAFPNAGYLFDSVTSNVGSYTITDNAIIVQTTGAESISLVFVSKEYSISVNIPQDNDGNDLADLVFNLNGGASQSSVNDAQCYGSVVNIEISNIMQNYFLSHYLISADGMEDAILEEGINSFVVEDYDNYVITPVFYKQSYTVNLVDTSEKYSIKFVSPDLSVVQANIDFDATFSVVVENIAIGYSFVNWQCQYQGDATETWTLDNPTLTKVGLSGNVVLTPIIQINTYIVSILADTNGSVSYAGGNAVEYGTTITSVATPNYGYKFVNWTDSGNNVLGTQPTLNYVVVANYEATANFEVATFNVVFAGYADDNALFGTNTITQTNASGVYPYGANVNFNVVCPAGYTFSHWQLLSSAGSTNCAFNNNGTGAISNLSGDVYIMAHFVANKHTLTFGINNFTYGDFKFNYDGWTQFSNTQDNEEFVYNHGDMLQVMILDPSQAVYSNIAKNYTFSHWLINQTPYNAGNILSIAVDGDMHIEAYFRPKEYSVVVNKTFVDGATISGLNNEYYAYGASITLTAIVNTGYQFDGWYSYDIVSRTNKLLSSDKSVSLTVDGARSLICSLSKLGTIIASPNDASSGVVQGAGSYKIGSIITLTARPNQGFAFLGWQQGDNIISKQSSFSTEVTEQTKVLEAVFGPEFEISITPNNVKFGSYTIQRDENSATAVLTALANDHYNFVGWAYDGQIISTDAEYEVNLSGNLALEAVFEKKFDNNIIIIMVGCIIFAILLIIILTQYIKAKEAEPLKTRFILENAEDDDYLLTHKRKSKRNQIDAVPVRKTSIDEIEPVPVRKSYTPVQEYKRKTTTKDKKQG
ncbi:MAG: InlB B-repeat-containing protein [Clostridia bacterium]|nr:InlB B-repeat-containing protein [Clostridia bacterium]